VQHRRARADDPFPTKGSPHRAAKIGAPDDAAQEPRPWTAP
jgi:hypothetical protein